MAWKILLGLFTIALHASSAFGNVGFWPGDAFFHFRLTEAALKGLSDAGIQLEYSPVLPGGLYEGFSRLNITGDTSALNRHLRQLHALLQAETSAMREGFHGFVYNATINWSWPYRRIGIKYNECWAELASRSGKGE